jgi:DNA repair exonuclease SbcCD ATPase subunit
MITSLILNNFQSHKHSVLQFDPGVNLIIGTSDSGKTAIIRALRYLTFNRPLGNAFRSTWGGETLVKVKTSEGITIKRIEGKEKLYILDDLEPFKAFGTDVPEEILKALNVEDINFQYQLDSPFLLSKTPGEIARYFNRIAKLDKIDSSQSNIKKYINVIEQSITNKQKAIEETTETLKQYDNLNEIENRVIEFERKEKKLNTLIEQAKSLSKLLKKLQEIEIEIDKTKISLIAENTINKVLSYIEDKKEKENQISTLSKLLNQVRAIDLKRDKLKKMPDEKEITILLSLITTQKNKQEQYKNLSKHINLLKQTIRSIKEQENLYNKLHKEFDDNFPDICPLCNK